MLTGENGIINRASSAKTTNEEAEIMENIRLAYNNAQIGKYAGKNENFANIMKSDLEKVYGTGENNVKVDDNGDNTYTVTIRGRKYNVASNGNVTRKNGVTIGERTTKLKQGESAQVTASVDAGIPGTISWKSSDSTKVSVTGSGPSATITAAAASGSAEITAYIAGTEHKDSFTVNIAQAITGINASPLSIGTGETATIEITTTPNTGVLEDITYSFVSNNTAVATVNANGEVTGVAQGNTTITITPSNGLEAITCNVEVTLALGKFKTVNGVAYYYSSPSATSGTAITASNMEQYLAKKVDYTQGGTYRIFYVDVNNKYGNGAGTIYLQADYSGLRRMDLNSYSSYDTNTTKIREMNPTWRDGATSATNSTTRGNNESNWNTNEKAVAYLCTPTNSANATTGIWKDYFDGSKADWVIGSPSLEMYCDSYNKASHIGEEVTSNYLLEAVYSYSNSPGYKYKYTDLSVPNATPVTADYTPYEGNGSLDYSTKYKNMYCGVAGAKTGAWWLASPASSNWDCVCEVSGDSAYLNRLKYNYDHYFCPLVALKSDVFLNEVEE